MLNPDGGRLKLGSLASTRCTGLVAKYTVGPLSLDTRWAVKRPSLITSKNTRRSHPQAVCSMHTLARSRLAVYSMQVAATHEGCLLPSTSPNSSQLSARCKSQPPAKAVCSTAPCPISSYSFVVLLDVLEHLPKAKSSLSCDSWDLNKFVTYCAMIQYQLFKGIIAMTDGRRV